MSERADKLPGGATMNALSIDVEDYFQVSAFAPYIARSEWEARECRVERNVERIMAMLDEAGAKATFFTLGWIAERYPQVVRRIVDASHELASHGFRAPPRERAAEDAFFADIDLAKLVLEDIAGVEVRGYRAPSFSINGDNPWAFDCLCRAGYKYSSSVYPVRHDHYGMPDAPRFAHLVRPELLEIPVSTVRFGERNWPAGGGGFFRLLPYAVTRHLLRRINQTDGQAAIFYLHPWELDVEQPRIRASTVRRVATTSTCTAPRPLQQHWPTSSGGASTGFSDRLPVEAAPLASAPDAGALLDRSEILATDAEPVRAAFSAPRARR
jgi:polysaccharide deacetylase family protein (PEP-CTERM system associated)